MEHFTFFDYSGLDQDEAASIKLFLEFATNESGTIFEPKICSPSSSSVSSKNLSKPLGQDEATIEKTFEPTNLLTNDTVDECMDNSSNNDIQNKISSEPTSFKSNVTSWSGLFQSNSKNQQNLNTIKTHPKIDKVEFSKEEKDYPSLKALDTTSVSNQRKPNYIPYCIIPVNEDPLSPTIRRVLENWSNDETISLYEPCPLINEGNWCYVNSVLQALLCLPPFYSLFSKLGTVLTTQNPSNFSTKKSSAPVTLAFSQFVYANYVVDKMPTNPKIAQPSNPQNSSNLLKSNQTLNVATAIKPTPIYDIIPLCISSDFSGRQQDAEEFLSSVLNAMHEEMSRTLTNQVTEARHVTMPTNRVPEADHVVALANEAAGEDDEWEKVGRKGRSTLTRETKIPKSPISAMFGGVLRSNVQHQCCKDSANLQPFFVLPLDIQPGYVRNLNDALRHTFAKEHLPDYYCPKSKKSIDAYRILQIESVPEILVFQIKSFVFNSSDGTSKKLLKSILFPLTLDLNKEVLSRPGSQQLTRNYQLRSVIYHVGKSIQGGHYVTSFKQHNADSSDDWYLADDANISRVKLDEITSMFPANKENFKPAPKPVQNSQCNVTPYLLFYTKCRRGNGARKGETVKKHK